jgi:hypothetical protein
MSFWWHKRDKSGKRNLWQIDVEPLIIFVILGLLAALVGPRLLHRITSHEKQSENIYEIDRQAFTGFEKCNPRDKLTPVVYDLITQRQPIRKEENTLTYNIKTEVLGLPATQITLGICDDGSQDCGWGSFIAVTIPRSFSEVRKHLKTATGIDFTEELRDKESEVTLRPVLSSGKSGNESVLSCDPGIL